MNEDHIVFNRLKLLVRQFGLKQIPFLLTRQGVNVKFLKMFLMAEQVDY
jgi:hypothetical protein